MGVQTKICPFCSEEIDVRLPRCPFCSEDLNSGSASVLNGSVAGMASATPQVPPSVAPDANPGATPETNGTPGNPAAMNPAMMNPAMMNVPLKSNAPLIMGIIASVLTFPSLLCAGACSGLARSVNMPFNPVNVYIAAIIACFIFSFTAKSKLSTLTGSLEIIAALVVIVCSFLTMNFFAGVGGGILYLISGIISILNSSRR